MEEIAMNQQKNKVIGRKLILFPTPWQGHITPMLHLANLLYSKSFSITIIQTRHRTLDPKCFPHFTFCSLNDEVSENKSVSSDNLIPSLAELQENCREPFRVCLGRVLDGVEPGSEPFKCLIADSLWRFLGDVAESFNLRRIAFRTTSMSAFVVNDYLPYFKDKGYFLQGPDPKEPLHEIPPFRVKDLPGEDHHDVIASIVHQTKTSHGVICNSFKELESPSITRVREILSIPVFPIGPLHKYSPTSASSILTEDHTSISWLDKQPPNSVLYVSFGSMAAISSTDFLEIAWALANSKQPFLWVVRPGLSQCPLPEGYLEIVKDRGHIVKWAPQVEVLAHPAVGGFWTHCGWNSTIESISEGVPMLCLPFFVDQAMNARHVSETWKTGLVLENGIRRDEIEKGIRRLMVEEEGEAMRSRAASFKNFATQCLMEGGSSSKALDALTSYLFN
ncbi:UDP-glycosyltransferase 76B1-like [Silene latifolia]|uniref:UDP-glycosyltransferase 76B1-like n=1 Tax=Silene latifolia TaxID=37657 RepID=UPI003D772C2A